MLRLFLIFLAFLAITAYGTYHRYEYGLHQHWQQPHATSHDEAVILVIEPGTSSKAIIEQLAAQDLIADPLWFRFFSTWFEHIHSYKAGEYAFQPGLSPEEISKRLIAGQIIERNITIPEGWLSKQIITQLRNTELLTGELTHLPKEGTLLPETYRYIRGESRASILKKMSDAMNRLLQEAWKSRADDLPYDTPYQALILASIVEKETGIGAERQKVAGVFVNRLRKGMKLQSDPTANYGIYQQTGALKKRMLRKDIQHVSAYNTYLIDGLPPAPICHPGAEAIKAVMHPADTDALYFVADGKGGHVFASTLKEHNRNVKAYYRWLRQQ